MVPKVCQGKVGGWQRGWFRTKKVELVKVESVIKAATSSNVYILFFHVFPVTRIFFVNSEFSEYRFSKKKRVNYDQFEIATKQRKSNIYPICILFLPFDRCYMILPCYLHNIDIFCFIYRLWRWYFWSYF